MVTLILFKGSPRQLQDRTCLISCHQLQWLHIEFQNSDKLSCGKMIKWFMLRFAGREKCKGCQSGSWEQMSYSSWSSPIRLSFPISSHNWQPRFTSWEKGGGLGLGAMWINTTIPSTRLVQTRSYHEYLMDVSSQKWLHYFACIGQEPLRSIHVYHFEKWPLIKHRSIWDSLLLLFQVTCSSRQSVLQLTNSISSILIGWEEESLCWDALNIIFAIIHRIYWPWTCYLPRAQRKYILVCFICWIL